MTVETETLNPAKPSLIARGSGFLKALALVVFVAAVSAWIALGVGLYLDLARGTVLILALVAGLATEALFWTVAALLGVSVIRARAWIWGKVTGRGAGS